VSDEDDAPASGPSSASARARRRTGKQRLQGSPPDAPDPSCLGLRTAADGPARLSDDDEDDAEDAAQHHAVLASVAEADAAFWWNDMPSSGASGAAAGRGVKRPAQLPQYDGAGDEGDTDDDGNGAARVLRPGPSGRVAKAPGRDRPSDGIAAYERQHWRPTAATLARWPRLQLRVPPPAVGANADLAEFPMAVSVRMAHTDAPTPLDGQRLSDAAPGADALVWLGTTERIAPWSPSPAHGTLTPPEPSSPSVSLSPHIVRASSSITTPAPTPPAPARAEVCASGDDARAAPSERVWRLAQAPPDRARVSATWAAYDLPGVVYRQPFYSNPADVPPRPFVFAGREYAFKPATLDHLPRKPRRRTAFHSNGPSWNSHAPARC